MAETRVGGKAGVLTTNEPWRAPAELGWTPRDRPRWVRLGATPVDERLLNASPLRLPWVRTALSWEDNAGEHVSEIRIGDRVRPEEARIEVLRGFARMVAQGPELRLEKVGDLAIFSASTLWKWLEPSPVDTLIDQSLGALADACTRPRSWLREERIVQPVSRVRRPARDAVRHLSRHPEHAGHDGVRTYPERILAAVQEEELDIYENRVLIGVVRRLADRAARRLQQVALAAAEAERLHEERDRAARYLQWKKHGRMRKALQRDGVDIDALVEAAASYRSRLVAQVRTLEACMFTAVGEALRFTPIPLSPLRETNILTWDPRYRLLPVLWRQLEAEAGPDPLDPVLDDPDRTWMDFCLLTLLRALGELGFEGTGTIRGAASLGMRRGRWRATVHPEEAAIVLELHREAIAVATPPVFRFPGQMQADASAPPPPKLTTLRFVPTFSAPGHRAVADADVWLHPNPVADLQTGDWNEVRTRATVHGTTGRSIAVAPWSFASVDRLGRLVQLHTLAVELAAGEVRETCPSCNGSSREDGNDRRCNDCGAGWGFRICNNPACGARVPKLLPKMPSKDGLEELLLEHLEHDEPHRWALLREQLGGRDLLADWCGEPEGIGTWWMVCPSCGQCGRPGCGARHLPG
jgi:hypothetical protein